MTGFFTGSGCGWWQLLLAAMLVLPGCAPTPVAPAGQAAYDHIPATDVTAPMDYLIGPLDRLRIDVFREPDLSLENTTVDTDGIVQLPLIGPLKVSGLTSSQASRLIEQRLSGRYLAQPSVSVVVAESSRRRVTVDGAVVQPGVYEMPGRISLVDAVALARGLGPTARASQAVVIRRVDGQRVAGVFDLNRIRSSVDPDPEIIAGDQVIVGSSTLRSVYRDMIASAGLLALVFRPF